jgi:hypothetical protein
MANKVYPKYKKALMSGGANVNLLTGNVKTLMVDLGAYTYSDAHEFLSDIPEAAVIGTSGVISGKSVSDAAAFLSTNSHWDSVSGVSVEAAVMVIDTGSRATSRLVAFWDTDVIGLPVTPAGAGYNGIPNSGGWFVL